MSKSTSTNRYVCGRYSTPALNQLSEEINKLSKMIRNPCNEISPDVPEKDILFHKYWDTYNRGRVSLQTLTEKILMMCDWADVEVRPIPRDWDDSTFESDFVWEGA